MLFRSAVSVITPENPDHADGAAPNPVQPVVVPRWIQMVLLPLAILGGWLLIRASGWVFLVFVVASLVALMLNPLVRLLERVMPRGLAIPVVYLGCVATIANPTAGKMYRLFPWPGTNVLFPYRTGGNGTPAAYSARPSDQ